MTPPVRAPCFLQIAGVFPTEASLLRLASAVVSEISDDWESERAHRNMEAGDGTVLALDGGAAGTAIFWGRQSSWWAMKNRGCGRE